MNFEHLLETNKKIKEACFETLKIKDVCNFGFILKEGNFILEIIEENNVLKIKSIKENAWRS
jgi:hypothetical protein